MVKLSILNTETFYFSIKLYREFFCLFICFHTILHTIQNLKKKKRKFSFGRCKKGVDFKSEMKGKELVSDTLKNTRDKGIDFFQSI